MKSQALPHAGTRSGSIAGIPNKSPMASPLPIPVIVLPGSGCTPTRECNFYDWFGKTIDGIEIPGTSPGTTSIKKYKSIMRNMPDPHVCRETKWIPFINSELLPAGKSRDTVVVGHSSGAVAAMRLAERTKLKGIILVATYDSDLGDANERASGYFSRPFDWQSIIENCEFVCAVGGTQDDLVDITIQRRVATECLGLAPGVLKKEWRELENNHFFSPPCPELVELLERNVDACSV